MSSDPVASTIAAGDRYPTRQVCGAGCVHAADGGGSSASISFLAVQPYDYVFHAPVKGRWLDRALLEVFVREFAYVPHDDASVAGAASDYVDGLVAYVDELCNGTLSLEGREEECRAAGVQYRRALLALSEQRAVFATSDDLNCDAQDVKSDCAHREDAWTTARRYVAAAMPSAAAVHAWLIGRAPQRLLLLRQKDTIVHHVRRVEGRIYDNDPIVVIRCDLTACAHEVESGNAMLVVHKPAGLPVHPSGSYRKNSVTSILEDVFGGVDRERYTCVEHSSSGVENEADTPFVSIVHREYGFELIRVILQHTPACTAPSCLASSHGVSRADWHALHSLMQQPPSTPPRDATAPWRKRARRGSVVNTMPAALKVFVVHRLDAATSGVLLFGLNASSARNIASAIGHKMDDEGGSRGWAAVSDVDALPATIPSDEGDARGCVKEYLALVQGRVDLAALAASQHHCTLLQSAAAATLRVVRPIGCLSARASLYWCPGAARQARWEQEQQQQQGDEWRFGVSSESVGRVGRGDKATQHAASPTAALLAAKHDRLRRLTRGKACDGSPDIYIDPSSVLAARERDYELSLRTATSELRVLSYNADAKQSLLHCRLLTGRTHQLRVHLASLGHPIVMDVKYQSLCDALRPEGLLAGATCAAAMAADERDEVGRYYRSDTPPQLSHAPPSGQARSNEMSGGRDEVDAVRRVSGRGCLCPERICLHAWRYTLPGTSREAAQTFQDALPSWCRDLMPTHKPELQEQ